MLHCIILVLCNLCTDIDINYNYVTSYCLINWAFEAGLMPRHNSHLCKAGIAIGSSSSASGTSAAVSFTTQVPELPGSLLLDAFSMMNATDARKSYVLTHVTENNMYSPHKVASYWLVESPSTAIRRRVIRL